MQMFIWNNIFFSLGFDVRDHYKDVGGDAAAFSAPVGSIVHYYYYFVLCVCILDLDFKQIAYFIFMLLFWLVFHVLSISYCYSKNLLQRCTDKNGYL